MSRPLRVLLVEDNPDDAELVTRELARSGHEVVHQRVDTAEALRSVLAENAWDVVLSDFSMPGFSATGALAVVKESGRDIPFIIVSGTIGEESAVASLKAGANDFVIKTQLARLVPAIEREIRDSRVRRARRRAEEALRVSEERFRAIMNTATDAVISADATGHILSLNPAAERMFGYPADELLGEPLTVLMPEHFHEAHRLGLVRLMSSGEGRLIGRKTELVGRRRDGSEFPVDLALGTWVSQGRRYFAGFLQDISDRKAVEAQLLMAERLAAVGTLAAGVAHEINNPLAAVIASLELALEGLEAAGGAPIPTAGLAERLREAREAAERVRHIVRDLKIFARGEDEQRGPVDVEQVMESTLRMAWNEIRHRARLIKTYSGVPAVEASEARLGQVFLNIVMNAVQALGEGNGKANEIRISTRTEGGRVIVEIGDTGTGIPPKIMKRLFTPFVTTKPVGVGTGLGLSICHRIVTDLGGAINVETEVGKGTVFSISLPIAQEVAEAPARAAAPLPPASARRGRVLVVDDEPTLGRLVEAILSSQHEVTVAGGAQEALASILAGERYDVILCDLMMPEKTGVDLYEDLLAQAPDQARRMVFMTGGAFTPKARAFLDGIPNPTVEKPFNSARLRSLVSERLAAEN